jgi:hypothetical protein
VAPKLGFKAAIAPEWIVIDGAIMVRDRSVNANITEFASTAAEFDARLLALPNGRRLLEEIIRHAAGEHIAGAMPQNIKVAESV